MIIYIINSSFCLKNCLSFTLKLFYFIFGLAFLIIVNIAGYSKLIKLYLQQNINFRLARFDYPVLELVILYSTDVSGKAFPC